MHSKHVAQLVCVLLLCAYCHAANAEIYWLDQYADSARVHYPTGEEACYTGVLQAALQGYEANSTQEHRLSVVNIGPDNGIGERVCRGVIERRVSGRWVTVDIIDTRVFGPRGSRPACSLPGLRDPETGQCGIPKCDSGGCPPAGGNGSNPIDSATGNKRQREVDYEGGGAFPLRFERTYNSLRTADRESLPLGVGWTHNYLARLVAVTDSAGNVVRLRARRPNGAIQVFTFNGTSWAGDADVPERLAATLSDGALASATYTTGDDTVETYDRLGRLVSIKRRDGLTQTLSYATASGTSPYVQSVTDPGNRSLRFSYSNGQLVGISDGAGLQVQFGYSAGNLVSATYPDAPSGSATRTYHYNESGQTGGVSRPNALTGITDERGVRHASWGYDVQGRGNLSVHGAYATAATDRTALVFNADGTSTITSSLGAVRTFGFGVQHRVARLAAMDVPCDDCEGAAQARTYDANGFPDLSTDFRGSVTDENYGVRGLRTQVIEAKNDAAGNKRTIQTDWSANYRVPLARRTYDAGGTEIARTQWTYNPRGQALTVTLTDPATGTIRRTTMAWCEAADLASGACPIVGLLKTVDGPRTDVTDLTAYTYYQNDEPGCAAAPATCPYRKGDLWKVTNALGQVTEMLRYDAAGRVSSTKDANGVVTDHEYHPRGWLAATKVRGTMAGVETDDRITSVEYWPIGAVKKITQPDGMFAAYAYDAAHRLTDVTDNAGNTIHYTLDEAGNRVLEETRDVGGALKRRLSRIYDQLGRMATLADADANPTDMDYDDNGNLDTTTDALGRVVDQDYDPPDRLRRTLQDAGIGGVNAETTFQYDALDNLVKVTDPKALDTVYTYDGFSDLVELSSPDTGLTTYTYDSAGNRLTQTDARGVTTTYGYDALNRLVSVAYSDGTAGITYGYDTGSATACQRVGATVGFTKGRMTRMTDVTGFTEFCYDRFGSMVGKSQSGASGPIQNIRYGIAPSGQLKNVTYPDGAYVDYVYDALTRKASAIGVTPSGGTRQVLLRTARHAPFGPVTSWAWNNGRTMARTLDLDYQPATVHDGAVGGLSLGFQYDPVDNLEGLTDGSGASPLAGYDYDGLNRLSQVSDGPTGTPIDTSGYDATGNRTLHTDSQGSEAYVYPATSHRLASAGGIARDYDSTGNTTAIGGTLRQFYYDGAGRMKQARQGGVVTMNYRYNGKGERIRRFAGNAATTSVYSLYDESGRWMGDYGADNAALQQVVWLDDLPVGLLAGAGTSQVLHYIEPDHLGTPRVVLDPVRNVSVWKWDLTGDAFGDTIPDQDPDGDGAPLVFDMRFPGQRYDAASGLVYNMFREYEAATGRYTQSDPLGLGGGASTYAYAHSAPLMSTDLLGLQTTVDAWCRQHPVECAAIFGGGALVVAPKPDAITVPRPSSDSEKCKKCADVYPEYDECSEIGGAYPYSSAVHSMLDFPPGSKKRPGAPAMGGSCAMKGTHHTIFLNGAYVGSIFSCRCCTNTGGGPVIEERWGNNRGR